MMYVTMTDKFLSGWGKAEGKIAKYVYECKDYNEVLIVSDNAEKRKDQKCINWCVRKPYYSSKTHKVMNIPWVCVGAELTHGGEELMVDSEIG